jgi:hypothetical protein
VRVWQYGQQRFLLGKKFVAVKGHNLQWAAVQQGFVAFQSMQKVAQHLTERLGVYQAVDAAK